MEEKGPFVWVRARARACVHGSAYVRSCQLLFETDERHAPEFSKPVSVNYRGIGPNGCEKGMIHGPSVKRAFEEEIGNRRHSCKWAQSTLTLLFTPNFFFPFFHFSSRRYPVDPDAPETIDYTNTNDTWQSFDPATCYSTFYISQTWHCFCFNQITVNSIHAYRAIHGNGISPLGQ